MEIKKNGYHPPKDLSGRPVVVQLQISQGTWTISAASLNWITFGKTCGYLLNISHILHRLQRGKKLNTWQTMVGPLFKEILTLIDKQNKTTHLINARKTMGGTFKKKFLLLPKTLVKHMLSIDCMDDKSWGHHNKEDSTKGEAWPPHLSPQAKGLNYLKEYT